MKTSNEKYLPTATAAASCHHSVTMETTPVHTLNLTGVLSESKRIILTNYTHFLSLSLLFLPLSFALITTPTLSFSGQLFTVDHFHNFPPIHQNLAISDLFYFLIAYFLTISAVSTVTYSAHLSFFGEPVDLFSALKSLIFSFFPLLSTAIVAHVLQFFISLSFLLLVGSVLMLVQTLGFVIDYNSIYFLTFSAVVGAILLVVIIHFHVSWSLAYVIVVVESKWGFAPLIRSSYLVKGMRSVSLLLLLYFGVFGALLAWLCSANVYGPHSGSFMVIIFLGLYFLMMNTILVRITAANTVLYNYCKALHGELAIEVAEGFVQSYSNLPADDENEKVPHVVTIVTA